MASAFPLIAQCTRNQCRLSGKGRADGCSRLINWEYVPTLGSIHLVVSKCYAMLRKPASRAIALEFLPILPLRCANPPVGRITALIAVNRQMLHVLTIWHAFAPGLLGARNQRRATV